MQRSTFVVAGLATFGCILLTFIVRGTTRLILGERLSLVLALPFATLSLLLVVIVVTVAILDWLGIRRMQDDLHG